MYAHSYSENSDKRANESNVQYVMYSYPRRARTAIGVDTVLTLDVCLYVC